MMALPKKKKYTPEEYLVLEREEEEKSEFHNGKIIKRAGSDIDHATIMGNFSCELSSNIRPKKAEVIVCGLKVKTVDSNYFFYPDLLVSCKNPIFHDMERDVILNPKIVIEIYSKETAGFDRNDKFIVYQRFKSIKELVFVSQYKPIIEIFSRLDKNIWNYKAAIGLKDSIKFDSVKAEVKLEKIYRYIKINQNIYERNKRTRRKKAIDESAANS